MKHFYFAHFVHIYFAGSQAFERPLAGGRIAMTTAWTCLTARAQRNMTTKSLICREEKRLARG